MRASLTRSQLKNLFCENFRIMKCMVHLTFIGPGIVIYFYSKTNTMHQCIKFILFWNDTLHVSDGLSVHHQEFKTVHTATGICQTDTAVCLLASLELLMMDGKTVRNMKSVIPK